MRNTFLNSKTKQIEEEEYEKIRNDFEKNIDFQQIPDFETNNFELQKVESNKKTTLTKNIRSKKIEWIDNKI